MASDMFMAGDASDSWGICAKYKRHIQNLCSGFLELETEEDSLLSGHFLES